MVTRINVNDKLDIMTNENKDDIFSGLPHESPSESLSDVDISQYLEKDPKQDLVIESSDLEGYETIKQVQEHLDRNLEVLLEEQGLNQYRRKGTITSPVYTTPMSDSEELEVTREFVSDITGRLMNLEDTNAYLRDGEISEEAEQIQIPDDSDPLNLYALVD